MFFIVTKRNLMQQTTVQLQESLCKSRDETALRTRHGWLWKSGQEGSVLSLQCRLRKKNPFCKRERSFHSLKNKNHKPYDCNCVGCKTNTYTAEREGQTHDLPILQHFYTNINWLLLASGIWLLKFLSICNNHFGIKKSRTKLQTLLL